MRKTKMSKVKQKRRCVQKTRHEALRAERRRGLHVFALTRRRGLEAAELAKMIDKEASNEATAVS